MHRPLLAAALFVATTSGAAPAFDQPPGMHDPDNAALVYYRSWIAVPTDFFTKVSDEFKGEADWKPSTELTTMLKDNQGHIETFARAAALPKCDWGIEYSAGFGALLPHLAKMRATARTLAADARAHLLAGEPDVAASRVAALFNSSAQLTADSFLISPLVAIAIHSLACTQTEVLIKSSTLSAAGKKAILDSMSRFDRPDPFGIRAAIQCERLGAAWSLEHHFTGPDAGKRLMAMVNGESQSTNEQVAKMDGETIRREIERMDGAYAALLEAWDSPDFQARMTDLEHRVEKGDFGPLSQVLLPALGRCRTSNDKAMKLHAETLEHLRACQPTPDRAK